MMQDEGDDAKLKTRLSKSSPIAVKLLEEFSCTRNPGFIGGDTLVCSLRLLLFDFH
jgi:hypothetical protein